MRKVEVLRDLQEVDGALDQARDRLRQIAERYGRREELDALAAARDEARAALRRRHAEQQDLELEIEKLRSKLKADSDKLYSGRIHSPRELGDLSKEVQQDTRQVSAGEDRLLALFDEVEAAEVAARQAEEAYAQAEASWKRQQAEMAAAKRELDAQVAQLSARRGELVPQADPASVRLYEGLRRSRGGLAVARIQQRTCQGCRIALPSSEEQKARTSNDLVTCGSCGRILYAAS